MRGEEAYTNFITFALTRPAFEHIIRSTGSECANHYIAKAVCDKIHNYGYNVLTIFQLNRGGEHGVEENWVTCLCCSVNTFDIYDQDYDIRKVWRYTRGNQNLSIKGQTIQSSTEKVSTTKQQCSTQNTLHRYIKIE